MRHFEKNLDSFIYMLAHVDPGESDDDREELLASASFACDASCMTLALFILFAFSLVMKKELLS